MNTYDCKAIQREIDEANLDARLTVEANEHLSQCDKCRRFHDERRTLRGLMAELETVGAPADFDFRLRARLARERPSNGIHSLLLSARPIAALALVALIAVAAVVVRSRMSAAGSLQSAGGTAITPGSTPQDALSTATPSETVSSPQDNLPNNTANNTVVPFKPHPVTQQNRGVPRDNVAQKTSNSSAPNGQRLSTKDSAITGAAIITPESFRGLVVVPVDARAFRLSIDNGRGGARTISLPPVSFGSQRLLAREVSLVPVSSAKGDW